MNHPGEITPLVQLVRPHVALITTVEAAHMEHFSGIEAIADAKAEIFNGLEAGGTAVLNADNPQFARLHAAAQAKGVARIVTFGAAEGTDVHLKNLTLQPGCSVAVADVLGTPLTFKAAMPGRHIVENLLGVLAAVELVGADLALAAIALGRMRPRPGGACRLFWRWAVARPR